MQNNTVSQINGQQSETNFQEEISFAIKNKNDIVFISYSILDETEERIKYTLTKILETYEKEDLFIPIFSCVKELISNAIKANAKSILIKEGIIRDPGDQMEVVQKIKSILNEKSLLELGIKGKKNRLSTRTYFKVKENDLIIEVINNVPLMPKELNKILERIDMASSYDSIAEFYIDNPDPVAEGMGLGLSMCVVLLTNIGIDYKNFRVFTDGKTKTHARIQIDLNELV